MAYNNGTLGSTDESGSLLFAFILVTLLAFAFDAILAAVGLAQVWPVTYTTPAVIVVATPAAWLLSLLTTL